MNEKEVFFNYNEKTIILNLEKAENHIQKIILKTKNFYEVELLEEIGRFPLKEGIVCDIGSNIGNHAIYFASILNKDVYAFESSKVSYSILKKNILLNNLEKKIKPFQTIVGNQNNTELTNINHTNLDTSYITNVDITIRKLDEYIDKNTKVSLLNINLKDFKPELLEGAKKTILKYKPLLVIKTQAYLDFLNIHQKLYTFGYTPMNQKGVTNTIFFIHKDYELNNIFTTYSLDNYNTKILAAINKIQTNLVEEKKYNNLETKYTILEKLICAQPNKDEISIEIKNVLAYIKHLELRDELLTKKLDVIYKSKVWKVSQKIKRLLNKDTQSFEQYMSKLSKKVGTRKTIRRKSESSILNIRLNMSSNLTFLNNLQVICQDKTKSKYNNLVNNINLQNNKSNEYIKFILLKDLLKSKIYKESNKQLIIRLVLLDLNDELFLMNFSEIVNECYLHASEKVLMEVIDLKMKQQYILNNRLFFTYSIARFIYANDISNNHSLLIEYLRFYKNFIIIEESTIEENIKLLPLFEHYLGKNSSETIQTALINCNQEKYSKYLINLFVKAPTAFNIFTTKELIQSEYNRYEGLLAEFFYTLLNKTSIGEEEFLLYFKINQKYKNKFVHQIRRFTNDIRSKVNFTGNKSIIKNLKSDIDYIYFSKFAPKIDNIEKLTSKNLNLETKAILESSYGKNNGYMKLFINSLLSVNQVETLKILDGKNILNLYGSINNSCKVSKINNKELVTVIVTVYNSKIELLRYSLESIYNQSYKNIEIIVVDDCSSNSLEIKNLLDSFTDIKYMRMDKNSGPYICRNQAIIHSKGRYIAFQDDDDISHPQRLEFEIKKINELNLDLVAVSHIRFDKKAAVQVDLDSSCLSDGPVTMVFKKDLINKIGLFKEVRSRGDIEFRHRVIHKSGEDTYKHFNVPLYYSYGSSNSLSSSYEYNIEFIKLELQREIINNAIK